MSDNVEVGAEDLSVRLESPAATDGVAPGVLAAVIVGILCAIALLFSLAFLMDRWNMKLKHSKTSRALPQRSTKITIMDDMSPNPVSDPPATSLPGPSNDC